jgi:glutamate synthase domain-containing protein 2
MTPILSEFQNGDRNARVYQTASGKFGVLMFDASTDYNQFMDYETINDAEDVAEDWVLGHDPI